MDELQRRAGPEGRRLGGEVEEVIEVLIVMLGDAIAMVRSSAACCLRVLALGLGKVSLLASRRCLL
jgi:hypothetical protein